MDTDPKKLTGRHRKLNHFECGKVVSHVQRDDGDWIRHTLMLQGYDVPFVYRRKQRYQSLKGASVNLTYYAHSEEIAGVRFEQMKGVRIKRA